MRNSLRVIAAGLAGGLAGNCVLGVAFSSSWVTHALYAPSLQSPLFIEITRQRDIPVSIAGLVALSIVHSWLFAVLHDAIPGRRRATKGLFWGLAIWLMFWVFQEWFVYKTLLQEPWLLVSLELAVLLIGSLAEGTVIGLLMPLPKKGVHPAEFR